MKLIILILFNLLACTCLMAQHFYDGFNYGYNTVFVDSANVRMAPSSKAKVIGKLSENTPVEVYLSIKRDTINGVSGYWYATNYEGIVGYIWEGVLCDAKFRSSNDVNKLFLVNLSSNHILRFKIFDGDVLYKEFRLKRPCKRKIERVESLGNTYNSKGSELIMVKYESKNFELFEWDGNELRTSSLVLRDDSYITGKYQEYNFGFIRKSGVNIRTEPSLDAEVMETLELHTKLRLIQENVKSGKLNGKSGTWHKVDWKGKEAYVWGDLFSYPIKYILSNKDARISYLLASKDIFVLKDDQLYQQLPYAFYPRGADFYEKGNMGLGGDINFLAVHVKAFTEGHDFGEQLYLWNGKEIKYFAWDGGSGDIGYSIGDYLAFPCDLEGKQGVIIKNTYENEDVNYKQILDDEYEKDFLYFDRRIDVLKFSNDTLLEIPSKYQSIRKLVQDSFPNYLLKNFLLKDFDGDGFEDAILFISKRPRFDELEIEPEPDPLIVILSGVKANNYKITKVNSKLVEENYSGVVFEHHNNALDIRIYYYVGYELNVRADDEDKSQYKLEYSFTWDKQENELYWYAQTLGKSKEFDHHFMEWENETSYFKTKKIKFQDAWSILPFDDE